MDKVTDRIMGILGITGGRENWRRRGPGQEEAALMPHIDDFAERIAGTDLEVPGPWQGLSTAKLHDWLQAVLGTWRDMVWDKLPTLLRAELGKAYYAAP